MDSPVLEVKNLTKKFGEFTAVNDVSFSIQEGEVLGFLGPNGAGKTTTIQMLIGVMQPTQGNIVYFGKAFNKHRVEILKQINYSSGYISLPYLLTIGEILDVFARLYEIPDKKKRMQKLLAVFEIEDLRKKQFYTLSAGQKSRVLLAKAFLNYPKIILLDEPTASLDPDIAKRIREFLKKEKEEFNVSMLFTSHNMAEVEEMCDRVIFIDKGKIVTEGTPADIAKEIDECKLSLLITQKRDAAIKILERHGFSTTKDKFFLHIILSEKKIPSLLSELAKENITYDEISIEKPDLEDFFLKIYERKTV